HHYRVVGDCCHGGVPEDADLLLVLQPVYQLAVVGGPALEVIATIGQGDTIAAGITEGKGCTNGGVPPADDQDVLVLISLVIIVAVSPPTRLPWAHTLPPSPYPPPRVHPSPPASTVKERPYPAAAAA